jgi:hypothetical protein
MARKRLYAEGTTGQPENSRSEIERTLSRYGAAAFSFGTDHEAGQAVVMFRAHGRMVRFVLRLPQESDDRIRLDGNRYARSPSARAAALDKETRRLWRALAMAIKAKLEVVESEIASFEEEFMAHVVLPDGSTVGEWAVPQLEQVYESGQMPEVLPGAQPQLGRARDHHQARSLTMAADAHTQLDLDVKDEPPRPRAFIPRGYDTGHCKYCKARVIWATMVNALGEIKRKANGQPVRNPVDVFTDPNGSLLFEGGGTARTVVKGELVDAGELRISHWATCPERKKAAADRDRKAGGDRGERPRPRRHNAIHLDLPDGTHVEILELVTVAADKRSYRVTLTPPGVVRRERILQAARDAQMAFWGQVADSFPEIKTGDFPPEATARFDQAVLTAIQIWVEGNQVVS